jgi:AsmA protein
VRPKSWILAGIAAVVALLAAAAVTLSLLATPQRLAPRIEAAVRAATGREFHVGTDLRLEFLPRPAMRIGAASFDGPPGFPGGPLLSWRAAHFGVRFWPLLRGRVELEGVVVDGLRLSLRRDAAGRGNWEGMGPAAGTAGADAASPFTLGGASLREARIEYVDAAAGTNLALEALSLQAGPWSSGKEVDLDAGFDLRVGAKPVLRGARLRTRIVPDAPVIAVTALQLGANLVDGALPARGVPFTLDVPRAGYDTAAAHLQVPAATLVVAGARLAVTQIALDAPRDAATTLQAQFELAPAQPRAILQAFGQAPPVTTDPQALGALAAKGTIAWGAQGLRVEPFSLSLDATRLEGWLARGPQSVFEFALAGTSMDLDRYLEPPGTVSEPFVFPTEALAALRARGTLTLQSAVFDGMDLRSVTLRLLLDEQGLHGTAPEAQP